VCRELYPPFQGMNDSSFSIKEIKGGITNLLYAVSVKVSTLFATVFIEELTLCIQEKKETLLVRLYGKNTEVLIDRKVDCENFELLAQKKFGPQLFGLFENGRIEAFLEAVPLDPSEMGQRTPRDYVMLISRELATMHLLNMPRDTSPQLWTLLLKWKDIAANVKFDDNATKSGK